MRLNKFQEQFRNLMLDDPGVLDVPPPEFAALFAAGDIPLADRLKVYRSNIVGGVAETLCKSFPLLEKLVGIDFLRDMARRFVLAHPPESGCLNFYGRGFDEFVRSYEPARSLPYLPDMAALEIAMNEAYYAPDDTGLRADILAALTPDALGALRLDIRSSVRFVSSPYALGNLREYCLDPEGAPPMLDDSCHLMVYRPDLEVHIVTLAEAEAHMMALIAGGMALSYAAGQTLALWPRFDIAAFLQRHLGFETFCALPPNVEA